MLEIDAALEEYIREHSDPEEELLQRLTRETHLKMLHPRMLAGPLQGAFLKMICRMLNARRVLEIGTYTGYSALAMALGMEEGGVVHTIERDDELEEFTRPFIESSGLSHRVVLHIGDARQVIPTLGEEPFDLVFMDGDKREYAEYYRLIFDRVRPGGLILADDVLWDGKVVDTASLDAQTRGIKAFNEMIRSDARVEKLILPFRHGLTMIYKK